ncbi:AAA family ATPase [Chloroflexota bacterium]
MADANDYIEVDGKWILKSRSASDNASVRINQINHPRVRVDDYSEQSYTGYQALTVLTVEDVMSFRGEGVKYHWGGFIPKNSISLLSGEAGVGKTTFAYNFASKAAKGDDFCGIAFDSPINILYCDLETGCVLRANKLELISEGSPPDNIYWVPEVDLVKQFEELKGHIIDKQVELVIVDTINEAFKTKDEQDNAEANRQFSYVKRLRDETGCSVILMHHIGKGQPGKRVYAARGASARSASVDVVLNLVTVTDDTICLEKEKDRMSGGKEKLYLRKVGEDTFEVVEQGEEQEAPALMRAQEFVLNLMEEGLSHRFEFNERGKLQGFSEATIGRALDCLVRGGKLLRKKKGIYSKPTPQPPTLLREDLRLL